MPGCSNPVQCQTAKRAECTCDCGGANHGILRAMLDDPNLQPEAEKQLTELKGSQKDLKKKKRAERRKKRAALK